MQTLNGNGQASYKVGGTIAINQNQPSGNYSGTYNVTVSY
jgi:spore coat protein U-like protein